MRSGNPNTILKNLNTIVKYCNTIVKNPNTMFRYLNMMCGYCNTIAPIELRTAVEAVTSGATCGLTPRSDTDTQRLSEREQAVMALLAQGLRDRDIANALYISDRTVKFHINNILVKLQAKTRFQALYQVTRKGWLDVEIGERSRLPEPLEGL